jgi:predicted dehydrogenase
VETVKVGIIGSGVIALANHVPGLALHPQARLTVLCDSNPQVLDEAVKRLAKPELKLFTDYNDLIRDGEVDAVIITTPNFLHAPITLAAVQAGKHVFCEKPIAMNPAEALAMYHAAETANVRHMTAFTYRFVPAMRYMAHLIEQGFIGQPFHFRANRFQDWERRYLGWRQVNRLAGSGELGDMLSHRLDYAHFLVGDIKRLVGQTRRLYDERGGQLSDVDDWVAVLADFANGTTGVWESTKLATGRGEGGKGLDLCEVNGSEGTLVYNLNKPNTLLTGKVGGAELKEVAVPPEFLVFPGSPRDPHVGDPLVTFRYDQSFEFIEAILNKRPCRPSFADGLRVQVVMQAILDSAARGSWLEVTYPG